MSLTTAKKSICKSGGLQFSTLSKIAEQLNGVVSQSMIKIIFDEALVTLGV